MTTVREEQRGVVGGGSARTRQGTRTSYVSGLGRTRIEGVDGRNSREVKESTKRRQKQAGRRVGRDRSTR